MPLVQQRHREQGEEGDDDVDEPILPEMETGVKQERSYKNVLAEDPAQAVVGEEMRIRGYKYGKQRVPFSEAEMEKLKFPTSRGISVLGFIHEKHVKRHLFMSTVDAIVAEPGNIRAEEALSALIHALHELQMCMLVRYVKRNNDRPLFGVCHPKIKVEFECLYFNQLPYLEVSRMLQSPT